MLQARSVLVVEDHGKTRSLLARLLQTIGFETVYEAAAGPQALDIMWQHRMTWLSATFTWLISTASNCMLECAKAKIFMTSRSFSSAPTMI